MANAMEPAIDWPLWERRFVAFLAQQLAEADEAHGLSHIERVVANARQLAASEGAELTVVIPAAWLHDCVSVPKDSPLRAQASTLAAEQAAAFLRQARYPERHIEAIAHAVAAHSYSANIPPRTLEAAVVQDADRLDSLGAIGIARCLLTGAALGGRDLYHPSDPFWETERALDDKSYSVDHFYTKLFKLAGMMRTAAGRVEAEKRTAFMRAYLAQLGAEIGRPPA